MRTTVRFWRWRPNALRRRTDRVEAWVVLFMGILLWLGAPAVGAVAGASMAGQTPRADAGLHQVSAVLLRDAPDAPASGWSSIGGDTKVGAQVRWTAGNGSHHSGVAMVPPDARAGQHVGIWIDAQGLPRAEPAEPAQTHARAVVCGVMTATATGLGVAGVQRVIVTVLKRHRAAALAREWEKVGPLWGHHPA